MYKREIEDLKSSIASARQVIKSTRETMARQRANKSPKHYQDSGKRNIEQQKKLIEGYKEKIAKYREKKNTKSMGKGVDSFKREVGKNTRKLISNKVFGDGHSTPHKVNVNRSQNNSSDKKSIFEKGKEFFDDDKEIKEEKAEFKSLKENILSTPIPNEKTEIMNFANLMLVRIKENGWKFGDKEEYINNFSDVCLAKLEQCKRNLTSISATEDALYIEDEIKKLKKKRFLQKYSIFIIAGIIALALFIAYQLGYLKD